MNNVETATSDGTIVSSSNTYGAYLERTTGTCAGADNGGWGSDYNAPCQEQLFTQTSAPLTLTQVHNLQQGVLDITVCNNNTSDAYSWYNQSLWVTTNLKAASSSRSWTATPLTTTVNGNQGISAGTHSVLACDPNNPNIIYASNTTGVHAAGNGLSGASASFALVSGIGTVGTAPDILAYDGSSGASTGTCSQFTGSPTCTLHFMVFVDGTGVYETFNGGSSFTLTSGGPVTAANACVNVCFSLKADQFGHFWAAIGDSHLYKYVPNGTAGGGTWSTVTPVINNSQNGQFSLDPTSGSAATLRIASAYADGNISVSTNGGTSWCTWSQQPFTASGAEPLWFGNANQNQGSSGTFITLADLGFDTSGNLRAAAGIGIWKIASANVNCGATWTADSAGIENLVSNHVDAPPGESPVTAVWDRGLWNLVNPDVFPSDYWPDEVQGLTSWSAINGGWAFDCYNFNCSGWVAQNNITPASNPNGGAEGGWTTWATEGSATINLGGEMAVSSAANWLWIPAAVGSGSNQLFFTANGATSWTASTVTGVTTPLAANQQHGFHIAADRVNANTFCMIDSAEALWSSTNSGATFTKVNPSTLSGIKYNDALKPVPWFAGDMFYSGGNGGGSSTGFNLWKITKTTNECDTATNVNSLISNIWGFGYGAPKPGGNGFPTIYYYGWFNSVLGLYELDNNGTTPTLINVPTTAQTWPNNSSDVVNDVSGDMNVYGRVYVGDNGSGFAYIDTQNACPWVGWSNVKPNATLTGTVTLSAQTSGFTQSVISSVNFYVDGTLIGSQTSGTGTPPTYSQSWTVGGTGSHLLTVATAGNLTNNPNCTVSVFNGTIASGTLTVNSGTAPIVGTAINYLGMPGGGVVVTGGSGSTFTVSPAISQGAVNMIGSAAMFSIPITE